MLLLGRKTGEGLTIIIPPSTMERVIHISAQETRSTRVRLGIEAASDIRIMRDELIGRRES